MGKKAFEWASAGFAAFVKWRWLTTWSWRKLVIRDVYNILGWAQKASNNEYSKSCIQELNFDFKVFETNDSPIEQTQNEYVVASLSRKVKQISMKQYCLMTIEWLYQYEFSFQSLFEFVEATYGRPSAKTLIIHRGRQFDEKSIITQLNLNLIDFNAVCNRRKHKLQLIMISAN